MSMFCSCEPRPRMRCIDTRNTRKGVRRIYKCLVCGNTESTSEVVMVDGTGAGKRLIDPRESQYIMALVELRRQMVEMQAAVTRIIEGRPAIRTAPAVAGEFKIPPIRSVFNLGDES